MWIIDCNNQKSLIYIGSKDMTLFGEVRRLTDNIITAFINGCDECRTFLISYNLDMVTHSNGIGAADAFQSKIAFYLTLDSLSVICSDGVPTTCVFDDKTLQNYTVMISLVFAANSSSIFLMYLS